MCRNDTKEVKTLEIVLIQSENMIRKDFEYE